MNNCFELKSGATFDDEVETFFSFESKTGDIFYSLFRPSKEPVGKIILVPDIYGRSIFYRYLARQLVSEGYIVLLPELFSNLWPVAEGDGAALMKRLLKLDQTQALKNLKSAYEILTTLEPNKAIAAMGFSVGGTLSMMLSTEEKMAGAVIFYGFPARRPATEKAPFIVVDVVEKIQCPILAIWGKEEQRVPMETIDEFRNKLINFEKDYEIILYGEVGHSFMTFNTADAKYAISQNAWEKSLDFFKKNLTQ